MSTHEDYRREEQVEGSSDRGFGLTVGGILAAIALVRVGLGLVVIRRFRSRLDRVDAWRGGGRFVLVRAGCAVASWPLKQGLD